jgi:hypothetical protein
MPENAMTVQDDLKARDPASSDGRHRNMVRIPGTLPHMLYAATFVFHDEVAAGHRLGIPSRSIPRRAMSDFAV